MSSTHPTESAPCQQADQDLIYTVIGLSGRIVAWSWSEQAANDHAWPGQIVKGEFAPYDRSSADISTWTGAIEVRS